MHIKLSWVGHYLLIRSLSPTGGGPFPGSWRVVHVLVSARQVASWSVVWSLADILSDYYLRSAP